MYKLFIVDDEPSARYGLRDYIPWEQYGIEVIGEAEDGASAFELILELKPDIVLTDVKMPNLDGIELSMRLRERFENMRIIFISGHDDVEYLKSALKVEAVDYIFKPVNLRELISVVEKVVERMGYEKSQKDLLYQMNMKLKQSMPLLKEKFFINLVRDGIEDRRDLEESLEFLGLDLKLDALYCVFVISIDDKEAVFEVLSEKNCQLTSFSVLNICQELIETVLNGYSFENRQGEYVCILSLGSKEDGEKLFTLASSIKENLGRFLKLSVTIGVGSTVNHLKKVYQTYTMANDAVNQKFLLGKNRIISMDSLETGLENDYRFNTIKEEKLLAVIKASEEDKALSLLEEVFSGLFRKQGINIKYCQNICLQLLICFLMHFIPVPQFKLNYKLLISIV